MFNLSAGCQPCPACYGLVQQRVNTHRKTLAELHVLLKQASGEEFSLNDTEFESVLDQVKMTVNELHEDAQKITNTDGPSVNDIARLKKLIVEADALSATSANVTSMTSRAQRHQNTSMAQINDAVMLVEKISLLVENTTIMIDSEGKETLETAEQELAKFGDESEEMMKMAKDARAHATRISDEADQIVKNADEARNSSREAYKMLQEATSKGDQVSADLRRLRHDFTLIDDQLKDDRDVAEKAFEDCKNSFDDAVQIHSDVTGASVPNVDPELVHEKAKYIVDNAHKEEEVANKQIKQQKEMLSIVKTAVNEGETLLNETLLRQQKLDELMADADRHEQKAGKAAADAKNIVDEAQNTLETLRNFDEEVASSKDDAEAAVNSFPEVRRVIEEAEDKMDEVRDGEMSRAAEDVDRSLETLLETLRHTQQIANDTEKLDELAKKAADAAVTAEDLQRRVMDNETALRGLENSTENFVQKADEALEIAESVGPIEEKYKRKAENVMKTLEKLLVEIEGLDVEVNQTLLENVNDQLKEAEQEIEDAGLAATLAQIQAGAKQQEAWILEYTKVADELEKEVMNIEDIHRSLPKECQNSDRQLESESDSRRRARRGRHKRRKHQKNS